MKVKNVAPTVRGASNRFVGDVLATTLAEPGEASSLAAAAVQFAPGARTNWHSHPGGQTLYVISGIGVVATRSGDAVRIRPGDTVEAPPEEEHWHGATSDHQMCHVAMVVAKAGEPMTHWLEAVSDEDYRGALSAALGHADRDIEEIA